MKKLLSVLLTLVMAICLVNFNNGHAKADDATAITIPVYYYNGKFYKSDTYTQQNEIDSTTLSNAGISYDATKGAVILDGTNANHGISINNNVHTALQLDGATKIIVKGNFVINLTTSDDYSYGLGFKNSDLVIEGEADNAKLTINYENNGGSSKTGYGFYVFGQNITIKNLTFDIKATGGGDVAGTSYGRKISLDDNSTLLIKGTKGAYDCYKDYVATSGIYGEKFKEGSIDISGTGATSDIQLKKVGDFYKYCVDTTPVKYLKATNKANYVFEYKNNSWISKPVLPIDASKDDNIVIKNTGSNYVTVNLIDGTTKKVEAGEAYTYPVKYNVKIIGADLTNGFINVYDAIKCDGISQNGTDWYNGDPSKLANKIDTSSVDKNPYGIAYNSGTKELTLSKNLCCNEASKPLLDIGVPLNITLDGDVALMNRNGKALNCGADTTIDGNNKNMVINGIGSYAIDAASAKLTLSSIKLLCGGAQAAPVVKIKDINLNENCEIRIFNLVPSAMSGYALLVVNDPPQTVKNNYEFLGSVSNAPASDDDLVVATRDATTGKYQVPGDTDALVNAGYILIKPKKPSPTPSPSKKDESCEKVIGPTWHWNNDKGICEDYGVVGTATR